MGARRGFALGHAKRSKEKCGSRPGWRSRIIHAAWWPSALRLGSDILRSQRVVCFADNAPSLYARQPEFYAVEPFVDKWIVRSRQAQGNSRR